MFNEKPSTEELLAADVPGTIASILPRGAVLHTTKGDITLRLFPDECPRTIENFTTHARNGYYDNVLFHRVIKGFMLQTGDPLGELDGQLLGGVGQAACCQPRWARGLDCGPVRLTAGKQRSAHRPCASSACAPNQCMCLLSPAWHEVLLRHLGHDATTSRQ